MLGNILLSIVSACTFISYFPQILKLLKTKSSNDLSINSWVLWVISSTAYTLYAIIVRDACMIFQTSLELFFCLTILLLAVIYRKNKDINIEKNSK